MPGTYNWLDPEVEDQIWDEIEAQRIRDQAAFLAVTGEQAQIAAGLSDAYPWLDPGVVQSLTMAGIPANHPAAISIGQQAGRFAVEDGGFDSPAPNVPDSFFDNVVGAIGGVGKGFLQAVRGGVAILAAPFEEVFERGIPAFFAAEQAVDPLFGPPEGTVVPGFGRYNIQNVVGALSKPFQGEFWSEFWTNLTERASPSTLALAIGDVARGEVPKLFQFEEDFAAGDAPDDIGLLGSYNRRQQLRDRIQVPEGGQATLGRIVAREVVEPHSTAYKIGSGLVDFSANLVPVDLGAGKVVKGAKASLGLLSARETLAMGGKAGLLPGLIKKVDTQAAVDTFINQPLGHKLVDWLTETSDIGQIYRATGQADHRLAAELATNTDPAKTIDMLKGALGVTVRELPTAGPVGRTVGRAFGDFGAIFGPGASFKKSVSNIRMLQDVPAAKLDPHDLNGAAREIMNWTANAKLGDEFTNKYLSALAGLEPGDSVGLFNLSVDMGEDLMVKLGSQEGALRKTFTKSNAQKLTRVFRQENDDIRAYFVDELGRNVEVLGSKVTSVDGESVSSASVHLLSELLNNSVPLPGNARDVKKATSFVGRVWDIPGMRQSEAAADWFLHQLWKPAQLVTRFAYPVRVLGEEQVRMAGAGLDSLFSHPISYLAWAVGRKGSEDLTRNLFNDVQAFKSALARGSAGWKGAPGEIFTGRYVRVDVNHADYYKGATRELQMLASDPVAKRVAGGLGVGDARSIGLVEDADLRDLDNIKEWFWSGTGQKFRKELARVKGKGALADDAAARSSGYRSAREAADEYVDSYLRRIEIKTGQNEDLIEAIAKGRLGDENLLKVGPNGVARKLEKEYADFLPAKVVVEETVSGSGGMLDRVTSMMFNALMTKPTNELSRSPFYRQTYFDEVERLMGFADKQTQLGVIERMARLGFADDGVEFVGDLTVAGAGRTLFSRDEVGRLAKISERTVGSQILSVDEMDTLAKAFALDRTRDLLYDLAKRSQFFDAARHLFPFGDAWKEIITAWSKIGKENPAMLRRFQQGVQGALGPGFGELSSQFLGTGTQPGQGFFYEDPLTGNMMFNYPGSELISEWMFDGQGAQVDFTGFVTGLNLFAASILPGVGPTVSVPVAAFTEAFRVELPETIDSIINPFGAPDLSNPLSIVTPAWMEKIQTALFEDPEANRLYINTTMDVMRAMVRSGMGSTRTPEELNALVEEAQGKAKALLLIRGVAQSTVPTGPSLRWDTADIQGNLLPVKLLGDHYRMLIDQYAGDMNKALDEWLKLYGTDNLLVLQGKTRSIYYRPLTEEGDGWVDANPDIMNDFQLVGGVFAPDPVDGNFDHDAWNRSLNDQAREQLRPREMVMLSNNFLATQIYENAKRQVAGRYDAAAQTWLAAIQTQLIDEFPGFRDRLAIKGRPAPADLMEEMSRAIVDPRLVGTQVTEASAIYFEARAAAQNVVDTQLSKSKGFTSSAETQFLRDWLRMVSDELKVKYPEWRTAWEQIFSRELTEDE